MQHKELTCEHCEKQIDNKADLVVCKSGLLYFAKYHKTCYDTVKKAGAKRLSTPINTKFNLIMLGILNLAILSFIIFVPNSRGVFLGIWTIAFLGVDVPYALTFWKIKKAYDEIQM